MSLVKLNCDGQVRSFTLAEPDFGALKAKVAELFPSLNGNFKIAFKASDSLSKTVRIAVLFGQSDPLPDFPSHN